MVALNCKDQKNLLLKDILMLKPIKCHHSIKLAVPESLLTFNQKDNSLVEVNSGGFHKNIILMDNIQIFYFLKEMSGIMLHTKETFALNF